MTDPPTDPSVFEEPHLSRLPHSPDPSERINVTGGKPEVAERLKSAALSWRNSLPKLPPAR